MISKLGLYCLYVLDQERARKFYTEKLGFVIHTDAPIGPNLRWLTVCLKDQPNTEMALIQVQEGMSFNKETAEQLKKLVANGTFGFATFQCEDIYATYEELKAKGVEFPKPPKQEFWGIGATFKDDSGNWFSLSQIQKPK
jgi:catechol 2,3-dioxygenase-like lactoylglutathione lyase family enzyme